MKRRERDKGWRKESMVKIEEIQEKNYVTQFLRNSCENNHLGDEERVAMLAAATHIEPKLISKAGAGKRHGPAGTTSHQ